MEVSSKTAGEIDESKEQEDLKTQTLKTIDLPC